ESGTSASTPPATKAEKAVAREPSTENRATNPRPRVARKNPAAPCRRAFSFWPAGIFVGLVCMRVHAGTALMLKLVCVCKSRGGKWSDDDYDVFDGERHRMHDASRRGGRRPRSKPSAGPRPLSWRFGRGRLGPAGDN